MQYHQSGDAAFFGASINLGEHARLLVDHESYEMPGRLFLCNFDFEYQLQSASPNQLPQHVHKLSRELSSVWCALANSEDLIIPTPGVKDEENMSLRYVGDTNASQQIRLEQTPLRRIFAKVNKLIGDEGYQIVPWGWSRFVEAWAREHQLGIAIPDYELIRKLNSKIHTFQYNEKAGSNLMGARCVTSMEALEQSLLDYRNFGFTHCVLKLEYGMSGRDRQVIPCKLPLESRHAGWVKKRLQYNEEIVLEPWVEKVLEFSTHYEVNSAGCELIGQTILLSQNKGEYLGNVTIPEQRMIPFSNEAIDAITPMIQNAQVQGYQGPISVDSAVYRLPHQYEYQLYPLMDINARWAMGRMALEWTRRLAPGQLTLWRHYHESSSTQSTATILKRIEEYQPLTNWGTLELSRALKYATSPAELLGEKVEHKTELLVFS